jgi:hypothetical protein
VAHLIQSAQPADVFCMSSATDRKGTVGTSGAERRRRPRVESESTGYLLPEGAGPKDEPWEVRIHDLSRLGVGFTTSESMTVGSICRIRIGHGPMRLARRMRVTNCRPEGSNLFRIGAEFA